MGDVKVTRRKLTDYQQNPRNPNKAGKARGKKAIEHSFSEYGAGRSLLASADDVLIAGNQSQQGALAAGIEDVIEVETDGSALVVVKRTDLQGDDARARELAYADNRTYELSFQLDVSVLKQDLDEGLNLAAFYDELELSALLPDVSTGEGGSADSGAQMDKAAELQEKWGVERGQIWHIGKHRLMCGDSTSAEDVGVLLGADKAALCFTSPPYNLGDNAGLRNGAFRGKDKPYLEDADSDAESWLALMAAFTTLALKVSRVVCVNVQMLAGNKVALIEWLHTYRHHLIDTLVWAKSNPQPAMAAKVVNSAFEYLILLSPDKNPTRAIETASFQRGTFSNVYVGTVAVNPYVHAGHGATFPLDFALHYIENLSAVGAILFDPFCGSGTTLVAAQQTGRICYAMELQPEYCAVILQRLSDMGLTPEVIT